MAYFPGLHQAIPIKAPPSVTTMPTDIAAILAAILPHCVIPPKELVSSQGETDPNSGMAPKDLHNILVMCGQAITVTIKELPGWLQECMVKHTTDQYCQTIIRRWTSSNIFYDDAEVPLTEPLIKMTQKRAWVGKGGNVNQPFLLHAMKGLSPFLMIDLSEDKVVSINDKTDLIQCTSLISMQDLRALKIKMQISILVAAEYFLLLLKKSNLVFALFYLSIPAVQMCVRDN